MADTSALRAALTQRAEELVETAAADIERQLLAAAGDALPTGALEVGNVSTQGDVSSVEVRADYTVTVWQWVHHHVPPYDFPPHLALDGVTFDETNWPEILAADPGEYPSTDYYVPGDHEGCLCEIINVIGDLVFDYGQSGGPPIVVSAFGQDVLVAPPAGQTTDEVPAWWAEVLTPEGWTQALLDAQ